MTLSEAKDRLHGAANGTLSEKELRSMARDLFGKSDDRALNRFLQEAGYWRIATARNGRTELEPACANLLRRNYCGPLELDGIDLSHGLSVVTIEDGATRWYIAVAGALPTINFWLASEMAGEPAPAVTPI